MHELICLLEWLLHVTSLTNHTKIKGFAVNKKSTRGSFDAPTTKVAS